MKNIKPKLEKNKVFLIGILSLVCLSFVFLLIGIYNSLRFGKIYQPESYIVEQVPCDTTFNVVSDTPVTPSPTPRITVTPTPTPRIIVTPINTPRTVVTPSPIPTTNPSGQPFKKGVAGAATLTALNQLNSAWFYNWAHYPVYKDNVANWDAQVWQKFVPLFYGNAYASAGTKINEICTKRPEYCNGGYYLIGNEPDNVLEDGQGTTTLQQKVTNNVERYGLNMKAIKSRDPNAKFIVFGLTRPDSAFINSFITAWNTRWNGDPVISNFYNSIAGIHVHTYANYYECPTNDQGFRDFRTAIGMPQEKELWVSEMGTLDGIPNPNDTTTSARAERERFKQRMRCLVNTYHNSPVVNRYAWFYFGCNTQVHNYCPIPYASYNLMYPQGTGFEMSDLGALYATFPR